MPNRNSACEKSKPMNFHMIWQQRNSKDLLNGSYKSPEITKIYKNITWTF